jgi:hypothetical protein
MERAADAELAARTDPREVAASRLAHMVERREEAVRAGIAAAAEMMPTNRLHALAARMRRLGVPFDLVFAWHGPETPAKRLARWTQHLVLSGNDVALARKLAGQRPGSPPFPLVTAAELAEEQAACPRAYEAAETEDRGRRAFRAAVAITAVMNRHDEVDRQLWSLVAGNRALGAGVRDADPDCNSRQSSL